MDADEPEACDPDGSSERVLSPELRLGEPVDLRLLEEDLAGANLPDSWLEEWKAFRGRFEPGDEVWDFIRCLTGPDDILDDWRSGYALVRDAQVVATICRPFWDD